MTLKTEHRILLSGTPLQNHIGELFNLLEYLDPNKFTQAMRENFVSMFAKSVMVKEHEKIFAAKDANKEDQKSAERDSNPDKQLDIEQDALEELQTLLKPYILRRFKRDVFKTFPKKKEVILRVELTENQKEISKVLI